MLPEQPAQRRDPGIAIGKLVCPFRQFFRERREAPRRKLFRIFDGADHFELTAAREDDECVLRLAIKAMRLEQGAVLRGTLFQPRLEAALVDDMNRPRLLATVGNEKRSEVGHARALAAKA